LNGIEKCSQAKDAYESNPKLAQEEHGFETYEKYLDDLWAEGVYIGFVSCSLFA